MTRREGARSPGAVARGGIGIAARALRAIPGPSPLRVNLPHDTAGNLEVQVGLVGKADRASASLEKPAAHRKPRAAASAARLGEQAVVAAATN